MRYVERIAALQQRGNHGEAVERAGCALQRALAFSDAQLRTRAASVALAAELESALDEL